MAEQEEDLRESPQVLAAYEELKKVRARTTGLSFKVAPSLLRKEFIGFDGVSRPLMLRNYQIQAVFHMARMNRFILGDDTGLGKTITAISTCCILWDRDPDLKVVVLTTKSATDQWAKEFEKFTQGIKVIVSKGSPAQRKQAIGHFETATGPTVMVTGYRSAVQDFENLEGVKIDILILDEASSFKNEKTQIHQICQHLSRKAGRVWGLTATLIKNNLTEGHGIYRVIVPGLFKPMNKFIYEYCVVQIQNKSRRSGTAWTRFSWAVPNTKSPLSCRPLSFRPRKSG